MTTKKITPKTVTNISQTGFRGRASASAIAAACAALLIVNDQKSTLLAGGPEWAVRLLTIIFWPVTTLLSQASAGVHDLDYFLALLLVLVYALFLFVLAAYLFSNKDLLWAE